MTGHTRVGYKRARGDTAMPDTMPARSLDAQFLARLPDPPGADLPGPGEARGDGGAHRQLPAAGVRRRGAAAEGAPGAGGRGQGVRAAGRRLRRKLLRLHRQHHPRHVPRAAADGGGADLRRLAAGGEDGPHGRAVRQAALVGHRDAGRRHAAVLPRRHRQRPGVHRRGAHPRSGADGVRLFPVRQHAEPAARVRLRRLCRPARGASLEPGFRRALAAGRALPGPGRTASTRRCRSWPPAA